VILSIFACQNGEVLSPAPTAVKGIENPTFVRVLPGNKSVRHPSLVESNSATISASQGGTITCGRVTLVVPAGALEDDTEISIVIEDPSILTAVFGPSGLEFNTPVIMRWNLTGTTAEGNAQATETLYFNEATQLWEPIDALDPPDESTTETELEHFSKYSQSILG
jgi:hypothetical protein